MNIHIKAMFINTIAIFLLIILTACYSNNDNGYINSEIIIPDISNVELQSAQQIIINANLIPIIEYQHNDIICKGNVIKCSPEIGDSVHKNSRVIIYISDGKNDIVAKSYSTDNKTSDGFFNYSIQKISIENDELKIKITVDPLYDGDGLIKLTWTGTGIYKYNKEKEEKPLTYTYDKKEIINHNLQDVNISIPMKNFNSENITRIILTLDMNANIPTNNFLSTYDEIMTATIYCNIEW